MITQKDVDETSYEELQNKLDALSRYYEDLANTPELQGADGGSRWASHIMRMADKAALYIHKLKNAGHKFLAINGRVVMPSNTTQGVAYRTSSASCNCKAGTTSKNMCIHMTVVTAFEEIILEKKEKQNDRPANDNA